ncbi:hypothetical protein DFH06DRAFT_1138069 [Mycena polygramma]|nr:hypothetical protein DFH06DRAFT_1138069 [Mycena polygramma]
MNLIQTLSWRSSLNFKLIFLKKHKSDSGALDIVRVAPPLPDGRNLEVNKGRGKASEFETLLASYHHHRRHVPISHPLSRLEDSLESTPSPMLSFFAYRSLPGVDVTARARRNRASRSAPGHSTMFVASCDAAARSYAFSLGNPVLWKGLTHGWPLQGYGDHMPARTPLDFASRNVPTRCCAAHVASCDLVPGGPIFEWCVIIPSMLCVVLTALQSEVLQSTPSNPASHLRR